MYDHAIFNNVKEIFLIMVRHAHSGTHMGLRTVIETFDYILCVLELSHCVLQSDWCLEIPKQ